MLNELQIRNVGVIEEATAVFADGLTVVTGETGAGKTMVVTGLRLLSGHRADASRVRNGADKATVDGIFTTDSPAVAAMVEDIGGFVEDGEVIASRSVNASGRSRAHLAGRTVAAGVLGSSPPTSSRSTGRTTSCGCSTRCGSSARWTASPGSTAPGNPTAGAGNGGSTSPATSAGAPRTGGSSPSRRTR